MCGILGGNNQKWNYKNGLRVIAHRGPNGTNVINFGPFSLGFVRLAIIDLSDNGMQPMVDKTTGITIVFNGEIYGYDCLRDELIKSKHSFNTYTDTEVVLQAYIEWGDQFVEHIDGMFAIAIYDPRYEVVKMYRDRAGIKPLYYYCRGNDFCFCSELKGILATVDDYSYEIDNTAIFDYYNYLYIPEPKTIYKNVYKLKPAQCLIYDVKKSRIKSKEYYWEVSVNPYEDGKYSEDKENEVKELIRESVREQLVADVPVGGFVSGGIDSSILTYEALQVDKDFSTFSMGFYDYETNELPYVEALEKKIEFRSFKHLVSEEEIHRLYQRIYDWYDEPYCDLSAYPTYLVSKYAKQNCTVVLSGDGGDELFGGYIRYSVMDSYLKTDRNLSLEEELTQVWKWHMYDPLPERDRLKRELGVGKDYDDFWHYREYYIKDLPIITRMQYLDFKTYLPGDLMTKTDRSSMAVSLEARVPFLSKKLIEFAFHMSQGERCPNRELKGLLKRAYAGVLPNNLLYRRKAGFGIPNIFRDKNPQECIWNDIFKKYYWK